VDWPVLIKAFGLLLVFEGLMPFLSPVRWREAMRRIGDLGDLPIRVFALGSMAAGLLVLWWSH